MFTATARHKPRGLDKQMPPGVTPGAFLLHTQPAFCTQRQ